ncbi:MAG: hypothetical protein ACRYGR_04610 [Janthinobacterium lividum]
MPQLDVATYFSQLFWLGFFFILLLVVSVRFMLPRMAFIHKKRWEKIEGTREQALALQHQAEQVQSTFEQHLAQARKQAQEKILQASKEILRSQELAKSDINRRLKDQFKSFESKVSLEKDAFMNQVQSIAQSLATDIAQKVLEERLPSHSIEQSVRRAITEKAVDNYVS